MKKFSQFVLAAVIIGSVLTTATAAESFSVLLQKGIFAEETEGNLDAAIKIYQQIAAEAATNRSVAAQAQYRLGICYQKKGSKDQAIAALKALITSFPNEGTFNEKAQVLLREMGYVPSESIVIRKLSLPGIQPVSISRDGKWISYQKNKDDIALWDTVSGESRTVRTQVKEKPRHWAPEYSVVSPDGRQITYAWDMWTNLYVTGVEGSEPKRIYHAESAWSVQPADWSADGGSLALVIWHPTNKVRTGVLSINSQTFREVAAVPQPDGIGRVRLSANGDLLAYRRLSKNAEKAGIYVVQVSTSRETKVSGGMNDDLVGWVPGKEKLVFLSDRTGATGLWSVELADGKPAREAELVKASVGDVSPLGITGNGDIYYTERVPTIDVYIAAVDFETGKVLSPPERATDRFPGMHFMPIWSHDGQSLGLTRVRPTASEQVCFSVLNMRTGEQKDFPLAATFPTPFFEMDWSHDGSFLLVQAYDINDNPGIHRLDLGSGKAEPILIRKEHEQLGGDWYARPQISPDGQWFYYARRRFLQEGGKGNCSDSICRHSLSTGQDEEVYQSPEFFNIMSAMAVAPDGKQLAVLTAGERGEEFFTKPQSIQIVPMGGSKVRTLLTVPLGTGLSRARWTPDGKRIVFVEMHKSGPADEMWSIAVVGGDPTRIELQLPGLNCFSINPDGRQIAFQAGGPGKPHVWVMENALVGRVATVGEAASGMVMRRVLTNASGIGEVLTADGKYICRIDSRTGDMVQYEIASGQTRRITNTAGPEAKETPYEYQAFSRDGKQIAYDAYTKDSVAQLRVRNLDGSGLRTLYSEKGYHVRPLDWSPDEGSILASRELDYSPRGGRELTLISTADGSVRVLKNTSSSWPNRARLSPDGQFIAFSLVGGNPPNGDVFLMTADGRGEVVVAKHPADDQLLGWTPDGQSLLFFSDRAGTRDIWLVHVAGGKQHGEPELLKTDLGQDSMVLGIAPDGSLYYETHTASGRLYTGELDLETGKVLVPPALVTTRYSTPAVQLTWSPDGKNLAYLSHPGRIGYGNNVLTIRSAATGGERFLSPQLRGLNQISWAPDGRAIIALGFTDTEASAFRIDTETSAISKLVDRAVFPHLCPDGKTLVFLGEGGIRKRNLDTGVESEIVKTDRPFGVSPDGREVAFQEGGVVKIVTLNGGEPREIYRSSAEGYSLRWTQDDRYIIARVFSESHEVWRIPARGGTPLKLDLPKLLFFALHPDNRRFAFSVFDEGKSELWVLENFLPKEKSAGN